MYIDNIRKKFGTFCFAKGKTALNPALLDRYMENMISRCSQSELAEMSSSDNSCSLIQSFNSNLPEDAFIDINKRPSMMERSTVDMTAFAQINHDPLISNVKSEITDNDEPMEKRMRFSYGEKFTDQPAEYSNIEKLQTESIFNGFAATNDADKQLNMTECLKMVESMKKSVQAFEHVCELNANLQSKINDMKVKHDREIKAIEVRNEQLAAKSTENKNQVDKLTNELKLLLKKLEN